MFHPLIVPAAWRGYRVTLRAEYAVYAIRRLTVLRPCDMAARSTFSLLGAMPILGENTSPTPSNPLEITRPKLERV